ncbi:MAG: hypothetical protein ABEL51_05670 [Salinibacter sp.]
MKLLTRIAVVLVAVALTACGASSQTSNSGLSADKIVLSELSVSVEGLSAYEVVQRYKTGWLRKRGPTSINNPVPIKVYLDGSSSAYGPVSSLQNIRAENVAAITHLNAREAHFRYGLGNVAGAIVVDTKPADE